MTFLLSRRGFLSGAVALAVAPAIIRSGLLMPIKPALLAVQLSAQEIATEFARQMYWAGARRVVGMSLAQSHVDQHIPNRALTLGMEEFSKQYLRPMAQALVGHNPRIGGQLDIPPGVAEAAIGASGGFTVRYIRDYNIHYDRMHTRFDVTNN